MINLKKSISIISIFVLIDSIILTILGLILKTSALYLVGAILALLSILALIFIILFGTSNLHCLNNSRISNIDIKDKLEINEANFFSLFKVKISGNKNKNTTKSNIFVELKPKFKNYKCKDLKFDLILKSNNFETQIENCIIPASGTLKANYQIELELGSIKNFGYKIAHITGNIEEIKKDGKEIAANNNQKKNNLKKQTLNQNNFWKPFLIGFSIPVLIVSIICIIIFNVDYTYSMEFQDASTIVSPISPTDTIIVSETNASQLFNISATVSKKINSEEFCYTFKVESQFKNYKYENCVLTFCYLSAPNKIEQLVCELDSQGNGLVKVTKKTKGISAKNSVYGFYSATGTLTK